MLFRLVVAEGQGVREGIKWEMGISRRKLLYIGWINKFLMCSTENYIQYPMLNHGKEYKKKSLCCTAEINATL